MARRNGFSLIELVAVIVVLAILAGVALPRYFNHSQRAKQSADEHVLAAINTALIQKYTDNRVNGATANSWITQISQVQTVLQFDSLPSGTAISGTEFVDQRGNRYILTAETATSAAHLDVSASSSSSSGSSSSGSGASDVPLPMIMLCFLPWTSRERRREITRA